MGDVNGRHPEPISAPSLEGPPELASTAFPPHATRCHSGSWGRCYYAKIALIHRSADLLPPQGR